MGKDDAIEMAMFRFGLIAPVINNTFSEASKTAYYRKVCADVLMLPNGAMASYAAATFSYWESLYRKGGFDALKSKARSDKGYPRKLTPEAMDAIFALRKEFPKINATIILERLIEEGVIASGDVSLSTVQRFVRARSGDITPDTPIKDRKAFESERVCQMWQADSLYGPYVIAECGKSRAFLIAIIDDKSRLLVGGRFYLADTALNFQKVFKDAVLRFGLPQKLYVDNGAPYKNDQLAAICGALGVVLIHAPVRDGAAKGKIERLNRTVRTRFLSMLPETATSSLDALNDAFITWVNAYNTRSHSSVGTSPMDAYRTGAGDVKVPVSAQWVADCFLNRTTRTVRNDATVSIDRISYDVPMCFIGQKVSIRFSPDDMDDIHIICDGRCYPLRPTNKVENSKIRRTANPYAIDYSIKEDDGDV